MAEGSEDQEEKTEEASEEKRDKFREKGEVASSRELTSVMTLISATVYLGFFASVGWNYLRKMVHFYLSSLGDTPIVQRDVMSLLMKGWKVFLLLVCPIFFLNIFIATISTFLQTNWNVSFDKVMFHFSKLNPLSGLKRMFSFQAVFETFKNILKLFFVFLMAYVILHGEAKKIPSLILTPYLSSWIYWGSITKMMFLFVACFLGAISLFDYGYNFFKLEQKMKMTKQEAKEEYKQREVDPQIKGRMKRMQREIAQRKTMDATKTATVLITNPTHFSIALRYELGMAAPIMVAKGADLVALQMRELAKSLDIPIIENKPVAQALYYTLKVNQPIPEKLYKAVSEIIRYVFQLKGKSIKRPNK